MLVLLFNHFFIHRKWQIDLSEVGDPDFKWAEELNPDCDIKEENTHSQVKSECLVGNHKLGVCVSDVTLKEFRVVVLSLLFGAACV